jgi:hypothetical protein
MTYKAKYYSIKGTKKKGDGMPGRYPNPDEWLSGPDPIEHDKYYAWKKHHAQARYRKEEYDLSWEDWQELWPNDKWLSRGRGKDDFCLCRINPEQPWTLYNCEVVDRMTYLKRANEYRELKRN